MAYRLLIPVLGFGQMVAFASSYYLLGVVADPMAHTLTTPVADLFAALSVGFLISAVLTPYAGRVVARRGGREVQAFAHVAFAAALVIMAVAPNGRVACVGIALLGLGMATGLYGTAFAIVVQHRGLGARRGITAVSLIGALGGGLGWPVSRGLIEVGDWRLACLAWAAIHVCACLPATLLLPRQRPVPVAASESGRLIWDRRMMQMAALFAGSWMVAAAMASHMPRLLGSLGMTATAAAWAAGLMAASAVAARLFDLVVMQRSHPLTTVRLACLLHPLGAVFAVVGGPTVAPLLAVGQGLGNGLLSVASGVLPLQIFGEERYAERQALLLTPARFMQAGAPPAYALALDVSVGAALLLSASICLGMLASTYGLVRRDGAT